MAAESIVDAQDSTLCEIWRQSVLVDLEIHPTSQKLLKIGALKPESGETFYRSGTFDAPQALSALYRFVHASSFIIGHNIHAHDWAYLVARDADFGLLDNKLIDTLLLNPLAFPENPYHHLVKDYKIQRHSINDPVEDCRQTEKLFLDQCKALAKDKVLSGIFARCLNDTSKAYPKLFKILLQAIPGDHEVHAYLNGHSFGADRICKTMLKANLSSLGRKGAVERRGFAYALAWLSIAGTSSVLPAWVRHQHVGLVDTLNQLRQQPCGDSLCGYCSQHHHLEHNLQTFFGYETFRSFGQDDDAENPLQKQIVASVVQGKPTLAILPTGGGKSLCYQLPAMMLARNRGLLTIVISPLLSLMRDQVQQLSDSGYPYAAALNSSLSMPERHKVLEGVRMGDIHLIYIAPEQLRNTSFVDQIKNREVGQWIIDEAHCLSKWGHDFRPDYLYIGKFIKAFAKQTKQPIPPVHAFTATARKDVIEEIKQHFKKTLGLKMHVLSGGYARSNLKYEVLHCAQHEKREKTLELLALHREAIADGAVVVFCNRRRTTEEMATFLCDNGHVADYFHAGRNPKDKQDVQQQFMAGNINVMAATNAFGMGVDKADIRLVVHAQMPDSLENYLQEAGRAGRDGKPASCVMLYNEEDADKQFEMRRNQQISFKDFVALFETIRRKAKASKDDDVSVLQVSIGEILRHADGEEDIELGFDSKDYQASTKVLTAIAWLEEKDFLERKENKTGVIQGTFLITTQAKIKAHLQSRKLSASSIKACLKVAVAVMQFQGDESINVDQIAEQTGMEAKDVFRKICCLQDADVLDHDMSLVAWITARARGDSKKALQKLRALDNQLLSLMQEEAQGDTSQKFRLHVQRCRHLLNEVVEWNVLASDIVLLLNIWGKLDGLVRISPMGRESFLIYWKKTFAEMEEYLSQRHVFSDVALAWLYAKISKDVKGTSLRVPFQLGALEKEMQSNLLSQTLKQGDDCAEHTLLALQKSQVIGLDSGSAIFHPAMTLHVPKNKRKPSQKAYAPLAEHYQAQILQVHVMRAWALRMLDRELGDPNQLLDDYFQLSEQEMLPLYFEHHKMDVERSATPERVQAIIGKDALSEKQSSIVQQSVERNMLVLAGPGSGKTRLLVHRVAWLVCVERAKPQSILILAFNRATVTELVQRLAQPHLLGKRAYYLDIHTYHSLAMRLIGAFPPEDKGCFQSWSNALIGKAIALLSGEGLEDDDAQRRKLMAGFQHILVDEYQDINANQYALLSAMAGRSLQAEEERLTMFAVGDDDQNIYAWNGASNDYIHRFAEDYQATLEYMTINYRSSADIVQVSNQLIAQHPDRMKVDYPIRAMPKAKTGKVRLFTGNQAAVHAKIADICQYLIQNEGLKAENIAILCRNHQDYALLPQVLRHQAVPVRVVRDTQASLPWRRLREVYAMLDVFAGKKTLSALEIRQYWLNLPQNVQQHATTQPLWQWLASYAQSEDIHRSRQEWCFEIYELSNEVKDHQGEGVHLGTMHSAKGLEFDTVLVLAGHQKKNDLENMRLHYVAMTRAERNLILLQSDTVKPIFSHLAIEEEYLSASTAEPAQQTDVQLCGMKDVFLGYLGQRKGVQTAGILIGDALQLQSNVFLAFQGVRVAMFSKTMQSDMERRQQQGWVLQSIHVRAMVQRLREDESCPDKCHQDKWDVVIPQLDWSKGGYALVMQ